MSTSGPPRTIDELLDRAVQAINSGDRLTASALANQVLAVDHGNRDAEDLLATPAVGTGELRRLTILFADVVDSTALSTRIEPEIYRTVIGRYRQQVKAIDRWLKISVSEFVRVDCRELLYCLGLLLSNFDRIRAKGVSEALGRSAAWKWH